MLQRIGPMNLEVAVVYAMMLDLIARQAVIEK